MTATPTGDQPMATETYYKILVDGSSCHGGSMKWSLPDGDKPGDWHEVPGKISLCSNGLHLTSRPIAWWKHGAEAYLAEVGEIFGRDKDKIVTNRARLLRRLTDDELATFRIFRAGEHRVVDV